jgi:hypothetical protein
MSTELYRKYIDIINENSQESEVLTEGVLGNIAAKVKATVVPQVEKMLGGKLEDVKAAALKATGGDTSLSLDNIKKVGAALKQMGLDKLAGGGEAQPVNEGFFDKAALAAASGLTAWLIGWSAPFILLTIAVLLMVA